MLLLAATAAALLPLPEPVRAARPAQAMVRIERPAVLRFDEIAASQPERLRATTVRSGDGAVQPARVVEFE